MTWIKTKTWSWNRRLALLGAAAAWLVAGSAGAIPHTITAFEPFTTTPVAKTTWYESDAIAGAGTASIVDLTGAGGSLEPSPLPIGAALLTTSADLDKVEVGVTDAYGLADAVFNDAALELRYRYYKDTSLGNPNVSAAPAIKLTVTNPVCTGTDCFGTLVYEPYQNLGGVVDDTWTLVSITEDSGLFWWTGGFGEVDGMGGGTLRTLADWAAAFSGGTESVDWAGASFFALSVGVGANNDSQTDYFEDVALSFTGFDESYNFEPIPEPTTAALCLAGLLGLAWYGRRRPTAATPLR